MAEIRVRPVHSKEDLDKFIRVPWRVYKDDPAWVPPLMVERRDALSSRKNPFFRHAEARFWIAEKEGKTVGRISAQIDRLALERWPGMGHFGLFECDDDDAVAKRLFSEAEAWLASKGMTQVQGPYNLSVNEECGLLVDGFQHANTLMMPHGRPYYPALVETLGYEKAQDLLALDLDLLRETPAKIDRLVQAAERHPKITRRWLNPKRFDQEIETVFRIFNDAWSENWGFIPMTDAELAHSAENLKQLILPHCCQICDYDGEPAAFMIAIPNLNDLIKDLDGKLLPLGWAKLLWRLKVQNQKWFRVPLMGVRKKYQRSPAGAMMAFTLIQHIRQEAVKRGGNRAELSWVLPDNPLLHMLDLLGSEIYRRNRIYQKSLTNSV